MTAMLTRLLSVIKQFKFHWIIYSRENAPFQEAPQVPRADTPGPLIWMQTQKSATTSSVVVGALRHLSPWCEM